MISTYSFAARHIGPRPDEVREMLDTLGLDSLDALIDQTIPRHIRLSQPLDTGVIGEGVTEHECLQELHALADRNQVWKTYLGMGYYGCFTPPVILRNLIEELGGRVAYIVVNDLSNDTFYARIVLDVNGTTMEIDSRPSDAIALAVRTEAPIYVEDSVLDRAGVVLEEEVQHAEVGSGAAERGKPVDPAELERLGAFKDFIEGLDLDDFDTRKG